MAELTNCIKCERLFVKQLNTLCDVCRKEEEKAFETVYQFMRIKANRSATVTEITEATGVDKALILKFVKEGRLRTTHFPNLAYPCERCSKGIQKGRVCSECETQMKQELNVHEQEAVRRAEQEKANHAYFTIDKNNRKK